MKGGDIFFSGSPRAGAWLQNPTKHYLSSFATPPARLERPSFRNRLRNSRGYASAEPRTGPPPVSPSREEEDAAFETPQIDAFAELV